MPSDTPPASATLPTDPTAWYIDDDLWIMDGDHDVVAKCPDPDEAEYLLMAAHAYPALAAMREALERCCRSHDAATIEQARAALALADNATGAAGEGRAK